MIRPAGIAKSLVFVLMQLLLLSSVLLTTAQMCFAICATVKIEIKQELTLERQAFDAHMRINNGLSDIPIEDVAVTVSFEDEDGNSVLASSNADDTSAKFFISVDTMDNIDNVTGAGRVAPETSADIHWLIIPAPGASNGLEAGTLYYVGATLTYTVAGESETVEVTPDYIFVKPMPQLVLDYFLPTDVYGDDAWTSAVEAPVPFSLGLRVSNKGHGYARSLSVESAQPEIVENDMGLLIGFQIEGSTVNGQPATDSLLADFGDIAPNAAGSARWIMSCTLSGRFVDFEAEFSHADELGGKMTSLIAEDDVNTHFLVHDVLVDAAGRDSIEDFLAKDDDVYRVYESDNLITDVTDQSADSAMGGAQGGGRALTTPATAGFMYAQVTDPYSGNMLIQDAIRSDGKHIKSQNVWLSKTRAGSGPWQYYVNIFDHNSTGSYTVYFQSPDSVPQPPVIMYIPERTRVEGEQLSFIVEATDPNGTTVSLSVERLPISASFVDQGDGSAIFDWTPGIGQAGRYVVKFIASDGVLESSRQGVMRIFSQDDTDGDGMLDSWEMTHFGTLERDGSGDFDGDGISDLQEFINGTDPQAGHSVPSVPEILSPQNGARVDQLPPTLEIINSLDPEGDALTYSFELYADSTCETLIASQADVAPEPDTTTWIVPIDLEENQFYYWRVRAQDATGTSSWAYGHFFIDTQNDPPTAPVVSFPVDGSTVDTLTPQLEIINATDPEGDEISYSFELYQDSAMTIPVTSIVDVAAGANQRTGWLIDMALETDTWYFWRAIAEDSRGGQSIGALCSFQVNTDNAAPSAPVINTPADGAEVYADNVDLTVDNASDADGDALSYYFEVDTSASFTSAGKMVSDPVLPGSDTTAWFIENLTDNSHYYWRVKANDGLADSPWVYGHFFVNTINEQPGTPELKNPAHGAWVNTVTPQLAVHPVTDIDQDAISYRFEIYTDAELSEPAGYGQSDHPVCNSVSALADGVWYYWRAQAVDEHGVASEWSQTGTFFVKINGVDLAPQIALTQPDQDVATNGQGITIHWSDSDPDSNATISLYYDTDTSGEDGVLIVQNIEEDQDGTADYFTWDISALEGTYYLYATIEDGFSSATVYNVSAIAIDHTPAQVTADPAAGTYNAPVTVELTANESAQIYYTLDGGEPDFTSDEYSAPLTLTETSTLTYMAIDAVGNQSAATAATYTIEGEDSDNDGMNDQWELDHFGTLDRDGSADFDGDGVSDQDEYNSGNNPAVSNAPSQPAILSPADQSETATGQVQLAVTDSTDPDGDSVVFDFELYADETMTDLVATTIDHAHTTWTLSDTLTDNRWYYWRARAGDGNIYSAWVYARFFVNTANDAPGAIYISSPQDSAEVDTLTPALAVTNSSDVDGDTLYYSFSVYTDLDLTDAVASATDLAPGAGGTTAWTVTPALSDNTTYFWQAVVTDEHGADSATSGGSFFVNTANDAPGAPVIAAPSDNSEVGDQSLTLTVTNATDADGDALSYRFELDRVDTFDSTGLQISDLIAEQSDATGWAVADLSDNTMYFWRAHANDGAADSAWSQGRFFVNTVNDAPGVPTLRNPGHNAWVSTLTPALEINPSQDADRDELHYWYELYADEDLTQLLDDHQDSATTWAVSGLSDNQWYYWTVQAVDEHDEHSGWMDTAAFFVDDNGANDAPQISFTDPAADLVTAQDLVTIAWTDSDPDSAAVISLYYDSDDQGQDGTLIATDLAEDADAAGDTLQWNTSAMADGTYYLYAVIADEISTIAQYGPATVTLDRRAPQLSATPAGGTYTEPQTVTLSADETDAAIYYSLDGTTPDANATAYAAPFEISATATLQAVAIDSAGNSSEVVTQSYTIDTAANQAPVADAGQDVAVYVGEQATVDGSASTDADSAPQPLSYTWSIVSVPDGSTITTADLIGADSAQCTFTPDVQDSFILELTVSDGRDQASDQVRVVSMPPKSAADLNGDGSVNMDDYNIIRSYSGQPASECQACDIDGDGTITSLDARKLMIQCDCPRCAYTCD